MLSYQSSEPRVLSEEHEEGREAEECRTTRQHLQLQDLRHKFSLMSISNSKGPSVRGGKGGASKSFDGLDLTVEVTSRY